jgi:hypothetical protein
MLLGHLHVQKYLQAVGGLVTGRLITDAKDRRYTQEYVFSGEGDMLLVRRKDGHGDEVAVPKVIPLDEGLVAFFGLYSGDGAKGSDDSKEAGRIVPSISFSQRERHLVRFAVDQFRRIFPQNVQFSFSLGEDSAYFLAGEGAQRLNDYYKQTTGAATLAPISLASARPKLSEADRRYLKEVRLDAPSTNEEYLAFYYQHKPVMEKILADEKAAELASVGIVPNSLVRVAASLRRPFKKGARLPGGSSRSDEIYLGGVNGLGELFLKMLHEIEDAILRDAKVSTAGLVEWLDKPSIVGEELDLNAFFSTHPYGVVNRTREYLTDEEVGRLMQAAARNRWGHRDATMVLEAYRHLALP